MGAMETRNDRTPSRRTFLAGAAAMAALGSGAEAAQKKQGETAAEERASRKGGGAFDPRARVGDEPFEISLAEWSLHRTIQKGGIDHMQFSTIAYRKYQLTAVEYVNSFFRQHVSDMEYLTELKQRADDVGVRSLLVMIDGEGPLAATDETERLDAIKNHLKWLKAASILGCHAIRVNLQGDGTAEDKLGRAADSLRRLGEYAGPRELSVIVENHGGDSSDGAWLSEAVRSANQPNVGTLPDFGNFKLSDGSMYDRYQGVRELMPYARAVSAKSHDFDEAGNETATDYAKMLKIVVESGYHGYVGIEYEGSRLSEHEGILATKRLLERVRDQLA